MWFWGMVEAVHFSLSMFCGWLAEAVKPAAATFWDLRSVVRTPFHGVLPIHLPHSSALQNRPVPRRAAQQSRRPALMVAVRLCRRVEINDYTGSVLRSFALDECEGAPHDARIVRRASLLAALRSAVPEHLIHYGVTIADVHTHEHGARVARLEPGSCLSANFCV
jgi:hypothetical protein